MIQMIGYLIGCLVGAGILTFLYAMTRPIRARGEMKSWKTIVGFFIVLVLAPYAWGEVLTRLYGKGMKEPIVAVLVAVLDDLKVNGGLRYYRVVSCWHDKARVIAVGTDQESWGGTRELGRDREPGRRDHHAQEGRQLVGGVVRGRQLAQAERRLDDLSPVLVARQSATPQKR